MIKKFIPILIILIISTFLVFYKYDQIPKGLAHDENELARTAFSLENKPYASYTTVADGHGTPYFYTLLLSFKIFGVNQFALRFPSRIFGILNVLLFYLIMNQVLIYKKKSLITINNYLFAIIFSLLLLSSHWYLHFTRISLETPFLLFLELLSFLFVIEYLDNKQIGFLILSGIFAGIAFNSYQPGRIFFLIPLFALILKKINWRSIIYFLIVFVIFIFPMSFYLLTHPGKDIRIDQQFFLKNTKISLDKKIQYLSSNLLTTSLMFFTNGDINGQHNYSGKSATNLILSLFFVAGLIIAVLNIKNFYNALLVFYFFITMISTVLTYPWENPNMLRTYTALPSIIYFISTAFSYLVVYINKIKKNTILKILLLTTCYSLLAFSSFYELRTYFIYQPLVFKQAFDVPDYLPIIRKNAHKSDMWSY